MNLPEQRKLTAIMFTDIQDFTKRMSAQEQLGMELLRQHNEIMDEAIRRHQGTLVKNIGDAYLVDFGSAVNAVEAAVEAQSKFAECNHGKTQLEQILVRISIHLGDVVVQGSDMFGDGVNIASRLQSITPPGGICISREVFAHVKTKTAFQTVAIGAHQLKGITDPVEVFQILTLLVPQPIIPTAQKSAEIKVPDDLSIAVLPFANWSDDKENEYFSDGITEDIITDLAKIAALRVSSRNSVFTYKGKNVDVQKVGSEMNVRYVLEGSVRKAANRIRITAQLIDASNNTHLWAERFDRDLQDVFAIQDEISQHIAGELKIRLTKEQEQAISRKETENLDAYDAYLKGLFHSRSRTKSDLDLAVDHLNRAVAIDPNFAAAHSALAFALRFTFAFGLDRDPTVFEQAKAHTDRALALEPQLSDALLMKGLLLRDEGNMVDAIQTLQQLIAMNPTHTQAHAYLGNAYRDVGDLTKALEYHSRAMELDPKDFFHPYNLWEDHWFGGDRDRLEPLIDRADSLVPNHFLVLMCRSYSATTDRNESKALELMNAAIKADPNHVDSIGVRGYIHLAFGNLEEAYNDFRFLMSRSDKNAFLTVYSLPYFVCLRKYDEAFELINAALEKKYSTLAYGYDTKGLPLLYRGLIHRSMGEADNASDSFFQAKAAIERSLGQFPTSPILRSSYGVILAACGEFEPAVREIEKVIQAYPRNASFAYDYARIYALNGNKKGMNSWLQKSLELGKNDYGVMKNDIFFERFVDDPEFLSLVGRK
jgi:adenylate cyclase